MNSFFGALTVWLTMLILIRLGLKPITAGLWAIVFGASTSQITFGSFPETYSFAACSLALIFYLMLQLPGNLLAFIPAGVFTFGVTGTNLIQATIIHALGLTGTRFTRLEKFNRIVIFLITVVLLAAVFNTASISLLRSGVVFYLP